MSSDRFQILISGRLLPGWNRSEAVEGLAAGLKLAESRAERLLRGSPTKLKVPLSRVKAERVVERLGACGVECRLQPIVRLPQTDEARDAMAIQIPTMRCPKCEQEQPSAELCCRCGIVVDKFTEQAQGGQKAAPRRAAARQSSFPYHRLNRLLQVALLLSLALAILSYWNKDRLPPPDFYDQALLTEPVQTKTEMKSFRTEANGIVYTIDPLFDYVLNGVVVSYHDSDAFIDIYHHKDWKDFLNIRDLCVIWGGNLASGVYREVEFRNATWTCWVSWSDPGVQGRFTMQQLSNNHLLANDPLVNEAIMEAEPGDQIAFSGILAGYSHSNGRFQRGSSTTRGDTGNGACETVFLRDFHIVRKANRGWRRAYSLSRAVAVLSLLGIVVLLFVAPVRKVKG